MSEFKIQAEICTTFWNENPQWRGALYHINNNARTVIQAAQLVGAGMIKGMPDLCLAIPSKGYGALYIELKKPGEKARPEQIKQHERLISFGNKVILCTSAEDALNEIKNYLLN